MGVELAFEGVPSPVIDSINDGLVSSRRGLRTVVDGHVFELMSDGIDLPMLGHSRMLRQWGMVARELGIAGIVPSFRIDVGLGNAVAKLHVRREEKNMGGRGLFCLVCFDATPKCGGSIITGQKARKFLLSILVNDNGLFASVCAWCTRRSSSSHFGID